MTSRKERRAHFKLTTGQVKIDTGYHSIEERSGQPKHWLLRLFASVFRYLGFDLEVHDVDNGDEERGGGLPDCE